MKAYILSTRYGTVQIGRVVYHIPTRKKFNASRRGLKNFPYVEVNNNSFQAAKEALMKYQEAQLSGVGKK